MNTEVAVKRQGIISTPNQPMYKRFSMLVTHSAKRAQRVEDSRFSKIAVMVKFPKIKSNIKYGTYEAYLIHRITYNISYKNHPPLLQEYYVLFINIKTIATPSLGVNYRTLQNRIFLVSFKRAL